MRIAIDIRSLQSGLVSGVENYTAHIVENILKLDSKNEYTLFYNNLKDVQFNHLHFINSRIVNFKIPNKVLNFGTRFFGIPSFNKLLGKQDVIFLPNFNYLDLNLPSKLVATVHDLSVFSEPHYFDGRRRLWHKLIRVPKLLSKASKIISVSNFTKQDITRIFGVEERKIETIYPGVSLELGNFSADKLREIRNTYNLPINFILFVSTMEPRKNVPGLIEAFDKIEGDSHLVLVGKIGWKYKEIFRAIKNSRKRNVIHFLGYVPEHDKKFIMKLAKLLVYPSFYEGFGFVPLEAFALGIPVLASKITSIPETTGNAALLVDPYDSSSMACAIEQLLSDDKLSESLVSLGKLVVKKYNWEIAAEKHLRVFESLKS